MALLAVFLQSGHREPDDDGDVLSRFTGRNEGPRTSAGSGSNQSDGSRSIHQRWFCADERDV